MRYKLTYLVGGPFVTPLHAPRGEPPDPGCEAFGSRPEALERARVLLATPGVHTLMLYEDDTRIADEHQLARELGVRLPRKA